MHEWKNYFFERGVYVVLVAWNKTQRVCVPAETGEFHSTCMYFEIEQTLTNMMKKCRL